jgi:hypothetical protein
MAARAALLEQRFSLLVFESFFLPGSSKAKRGKH